MTSASTQVQAKVQAAIEKTPSPSSNGPPLHSALVHFPIAFNILSWILDVVYAVAPTINGLSSSPVIEFESRTNLTQISYFLLCAGLVTTVPALMSGNVQLLGMVKKNGGSPYQKDVSNRATSTMVPRIKATIQHALVNYFVFAVNLANWYVRKNGGKGSITLDAGASRVAPSTMNVLVGATCLPILMFGSKLGATLVFNHGIGLALGSAKKTQ